VSDLRSKVSPAPVKAEPKSQVAVLNQFIPPGKFSLSDANRSVNLAAPQDFADLGSREAQELLQDPIVEVGKSMVPVTAAELYVERLKTLRSILKSSKDSSIEAFRAHLTNTMQLVDTVFEENLCKLLAAQRQLEITWRQLDAFYKLARVEATSSVPLAIWPASPESLRDDSDFQRFSEAVPKQTKIDMQDLRSLIVLPGWLRRKAVIEKFGELARAGKAVLVTDAPDDLEKVRKEVDGGELAGIKGLEKWKQHVVLTGNPLRVREAHPKYEVGQADVYLSPAVLLAAKMVKGDDVEGIAVAQANVDHEVLLDSADGSEVKLRWDLDDRKQISDMLKNTIIPLAYAQKRKKVFWGTENLSEQDAWKHYTVVRVREYIEKCLIDYMNQETFTPISEGKRKALRDKVEEFLKGNSSKQDPQKMLSGGTVARLDTARDDPSAIEIDLELNFKIPMTRVILEVRAEADKQKAWNIVASNAKHEG
jgi:hypothetical protein